MALIDMLRSERWRSPLDAALHAPSFAALARFLADERARGVRVLPDEAEIFAAYDLVAPEDVRVVIVGQDPYPTPGNAHGLAFSYRDGERLPGSLRNVFREVEADLGLAMPATRGDLTPWARQGVLLLNRVLTVRAGAAGSHRRKGWEAFTQATLATLAARTRPIVFLLWGGDARGCRRWLGAPHHVLEAGHPSPLSVRHFRGCRHFSRANDLLGERAIDWAL